MRKVIIFMAVLAMSVSAIAQEAEIEAFASAAYDCKVSTTQHRDDAWDRCELAKTLMQDAIYAIQANAGGKASRREAELFRGGVRDFKVGMKLLGRL